MCSGYLHDMAAVLAFVRRVVRLLLPSRLRVLRGDDELDWHGPDEELDRVLIRHDREDSR